MPAGVYEWKQAVNNDISESNIYYNNYAADHNSNRRKSA